MFVYVDLEHERVKRLDPDAWTRSLADRLREKYRLERIAGDSCLVVRYRDVSPALVHRVRARAVVVSGCYTDFEHYTDESLVGLRAIFREAAWPLLGICGGHQLLAQAHSGEIGPMGELPPGAPDPYAGIEPRGYQPGMKQERGFMPILVDNAHPLFTGFDHKPLFLQSHYWEVKTAPEGFRVPAASDLCAIQAIVHPKLPLLGVQFHPERYNDDYPDGRQLLKNFFDAYVNVDDDKDDDQAGTGREPHVKEPAGQAPPARGSGL